MYTIENIKYRGPNETPDRTYKLVCIKANSDNKPSFLIRHWGKKGAKGSAKIEMFDRASRVQINFRQAQKERLDKDYKLVSKNSSEHPAGLATFLAVRNDFPKFEESHPIFEVLQEVVKYGARDKEAILDEVYDNIVLPEEQESKNPEYDTWGTW